MSASRPQTGGLLPSHSKPTIDPPCPGCQQPEAEPAPKPIEHDLFVKQPADDESAVAFVLPPTSGSAPLGSRAATREYFLAGDVGRAAIQPDFVVVIHMRLPDAAS